MKKLLTFFAVLLLAVTAWAQNPKLSYQAVVRDNSNKLVTNSNVDVTISVLKADNSPQYTQNFSNVPTNQNGLFSLLLGGETGWDEVSWLQSKIAVAITLPDHSVVKDTSEVNAVPLAINTIHAAPVDPTSQVQSDWNQTDGEAPSFIKNKPDVSTAALCDSVTDCVLGHVQNYMDSSSHFQSLVGDQISDSIASIPHTKPDWNAAAGSDAEILNKPTLATVATTGSYNDLTDTPTIPTTVAELTDADEYAKLAGDNTFSGKNTFSDNVTFTDTVVVPSGFTFGTTTAATCNDIAVNACDLLAVFDSLYKRMDEIKENLQNQIDSIKGILDSSKTAPIILDVTGTPHSTSIDVKMRVFFGGSPITSREFCYVKAGTTDTTCVNSNSNEKTVEGLESNTEYYVWVKATNEIGTSSSEPVLEKTLPETPELSNEKVSASDDHVVVSADIDLKGADEGQLTLCYVVTGETDTACLASKTVTGTSFSEEIPGLDTNKTYTIVVTLDNGGETPATFTEDATTLALKVTSDTSATVKLCGDTLNVTYTATIANPDNYTYAWKVNGADSASATGNTLVVNFTTAGSYKVTCVATATDNAAVTAKDTVTTTAQQGVIPSMVICTDCDEGKAYIKSVSNVSSASWKLSGEEKYTHNTIGTYTIESGTYTVEVKSADGCTATYENIIIEKQYTHCTVDAIRDNESGTGTQLDSVRDHQDNWYEVVQIGEQCWLKENMRATTEPGGESILQKPAQSNTDKTAKYAYYYQDSDANYAKFGCLYTWAAAVNGDTIAPARGICPEGWHVPTDAEWMTLTTNAGVGVGSGTGLGKLTSGCDWIASDTLTGPGDYSYSDRNVSGFNVLPAGFYSGTFGDGGNYADFWSATLQSSNKDNAYGLHFYYRTAFMGRYANLRRYGCSVRCVRDNTGVTLGAVSKTDSTGSSLNISAEYTNTKTVTCATVCAYTDASCTAAAGECATVSNPFSPITGTIEGLDPLTQYYVKVSVTTEGGTESKVAGPFGTKEVVDTITFVANGGTGTMAKQTVTRGVATAINTNEYTHVGNWPFAGWSNDCDGNRINFADQAQITTNGNDTLYAQWHTWCTGTPNINNESGTSRIDSVKDHQDNWYKVVQIGDQCWLKENMRATTSPSTNSRIVMDMVYSHSSKSACWYGNDSTTYSKYGVLYNFCAAVDTFYNDGDASHPELANAPGHSDYALHVPFYKGKRRGICPEGWHVPTDDEWTTMTTNVGIDPGVDGTGVGKLTGGCDWETDTIATAPGDYSYADRNVSGLSVLPAGTYHGGEMPSVYDVCSGVGFGTTFWTASTSGMSEAMCRLFYKSHGFITRIGLYLPAGYSVRCVRD